MIGDILEGMILEPLVESVRSEARHLLGEFEARTMRAVRRVRRAVVAAMVETLLWTIAAGLLLAAIIVFFSRFAPIELVLLAIAVVLGYGALLIRISR